MSRPRDSNETRPAAPGRHSLRSWLVGAIVPPTAALIATDTASRFSFLQAEGWNAARFLLLITLAWATTTDVVRRRIPNYVTYPAFVWLIIFSCIAAAWEVAQPAANIMVAANANGVARLFAGMLGPAEALLGAAVCFGIMLFVFIFAGVGGGDVKLAAVLGVALGPQVGLFALVATHLIAGVAALSWVVLSEGPLQTAGTLGRACGSVLLPMWIAPPTRQAGQWLKRPLPMSPFFMTGTAAALHYLR